MRRIFVALDTFDFLRSAARFEHLGVSLFDHVICRHGRKINVAVLTSLIRKMLDDFLTRCIGIVFAAEEVLNKVPAACQGLGGHMGKIPILRRQMAVNTFGSQTFLVCPVRRGLPALVCTVHFVADGSAILRMRQWFAGGVNSNEKEDCKRKPRRESQTMPS